MAEELPFNPEMILQAYCQGFFPMAESRDAPIQWYAPDLRCVMPLDFHVSRSLQRCLRKNTFEITYDSAFEQVIRGCAKPRPYESQTWINGPIIENYTALFHLGFGHSVEAWQVINGQRQLVGGIYGLAIGAAFFGESMFSSVSNASKVCLYHLVKQLKKQGYELFDVQYRNPHLEQFGIVEMPHEQYLSILKQAVAKPVYFL